MIMIHLIIVVYTKCDISLNLITNKYIILTIFVKLMLIYKNDN